MKGSKSPLPLTIPAPGLVGGLSSMQWLPGHHGPCTACLLHSLIDRLINSVIVLHFIPIATVIPPPQ